MFGHKSAKSQNARREWPATGVWVWGVACSGVLNSPTGLKVEIEIANSNSNFQIGLESTRKDIKIKSLLHAKGRGERGGCDLLKGHLISD